MNSLGITLINLDLSQNKLKKLNLTKFTNLTTLNLKQNLFEGLPDLSKDLSKLSKLDLSMNKLKSFDSRLLNTAKNSLTSLDLSNNSINAIDLLNFKNLEYLNLEKNKLKVIDISQNNKLTTLLLSSNKLTQILYIPTTLIEINLSGNDIKQFKSYDILYKFTSRAKILNLSNNGLSCLELTRFTHVNHLDISYNDIINLTTILEPLK